VKLILEWIASGASPQEIANFHPVVTMADVEEAIRFSAFEIG